MSPSIQPRPQPTDAPEGTPPAPVLAVMFPLSAAERATLADELGGRWVVVDGRTVVSPDAVLLPPCSHQAVTRARALFSSARLIVLDGAAGGPRSLGDGPVHRALAAGADLYALDAAAVAA